MPDENGRMADDVQTAADEIVGNEQWADDEGNSGPDPAQWADLSTRVDTGFEPGIPGDIKGPAEDR